MKTLLLAITGILALIATASLSQAAIVVTPPTNQSGENFSGTLTITEDIHFTINTAITSDRRILIVLNDWVESDATTSMGSIFPSLSFSLNQTTINHTADRSIFFDNRNEIDGDISPNDGIFMILPIVSMDIGDLFTLKSGSYIWQIAASSTFNPEVAQTFTGSMFLAANTGGETASRISNEVTLISAVPEPTQALGMIALLSGGFCFRRRNR
jgi:hypothetical protein